MKFDLARDSKTTLEHSQRECLFELLDNEVVSQVIGYNIGR